jgi:hypothetical protein
LTNDDVLTVSQEQQIDRNKLLFLFGIFWKQFDNKLVAAHASLMLEKIADND